MKKTLLAAALLLPATALATPFTSESPSGLDVTTVGASTVGGVVVDLVGANGAQVVSQLSASSLHEGYASSNPLEIGTQTGFDSSITGSLGGGLTSASFRFSLEDGDTAAGNFDENENDLLINGLNFGDWSAVNAQNTTSTGTAGGSGFSGGGFRNNILDTGWFTSNDSTLMSDLFSSLISTEQIVFGLDDVDPYDNYFDFTQGIDNSLINIGQGPSVTPPPSSVPEPSSLALLGLALGGLVSVRRRKA